MIYATILAAILAALNGLAHKDPAETQNARTARLALTAGAIWSASQRATCTGDWAGAPEDVCRRLWLGPPQELAAMLVTIGSFESGFVARIQDGDCRVIQGYHECDGGRARSYWQFWRLGQVRATWLESVGLRRVPLENAAWGASRLLSQWRAVCGRSAGPAWAEATIAGYARGNACTWSKAPARVAVFRRVLAQLARAPPTR